MTAIDKQRLAKLLGMVGSDADGEALNAARAANGLVRSAGLTWFEVFEVDPAAADLDAAIDLCRRYPQALTAWEREFLQSIAGAVSLTPKQTAVLDRMTLKARAFARRRGAA